MPISKPMRIARRTLLLTVLALTACGSEAKPTGTPGEKSSGLASDLALPVTAPMMARKRLLHDLGQQKSAARQRAKLFGEAVEQKH